MAAVEEVLRFADRAHELPRLGGIARPDGVIIVSERYWALARTDGSLDEGEMRQCTRWVTRTPMLRGFARLVLALSPLGAARVSSRHERLVTAAALLASVGLAFLPAAEQLGAGVLLLAVLLAWLFRGRTRHLHGAEHRAIAAAEAGELVASWSGESRPSRFAVRCGTNLTALVTIVVGLLYLFPVARDVWTALPLQVGALGATMELWFAIHKSRWRWPKACLLPGLALQRLTTREPALSETRVALQAAASVLRRELRGS